MDPPASKPATPAAVAPTVAPVPVAGAPPALLAGALSPDAALAAATENLALSPPRGGPLPAPPASAPPMGSTGGGATSGAASAATSAPSSPGPTLNIFPPGITRAPSPGYKRIKKEKKAVASEHPDYLQMILTAQIYDVARETPLHYAEFLSNRIGSKIYFKREDMQPAFSFKIRGAYNKLKNLTPDERARGIIAASAGNHAQGVALAAKVLGIKATIVMPVTAPEIKVANVRRLGGIVVQSGIDLEGARSKAVELQKEHGYTMVPPYDDKYIIAGQGTAGVEILRQVPNGKVDAIFVCCGGGGLLAGIAVYVKRLYPDIKVIGVEEVDQNSMSLALQYGHPVTMPEIDLFADGTAVRRAGDETFRLVQENVDEMVLVTNDEICAAIKDVFTDTRSILEPSGALSVAGCKRWIADNNVQGGTFVCLTSGANMNFDRLRFVAERAAIGEETEALISVIMPERPGSFLALLNAILPRTVTELSYRYNKTDAAHVFASFRVSPGRSRAEEVADLLANLEALGMKGVDISKDEFAKSHGRYLVGGRMPVAHERVVRSEFRVTGREMIRDLLAHFSPDYNQLLFHFKDDGNIGHVAMGFEVLPERTTDFNERIEKVSTKFHVSCTEETDNVVFKHFFAAS